MKIQVDSSFFCGYAAVALQRHLGGSRAEAVGYTIMCRAFALDTADPATGSLADVDPLDVEAALFWQGEGSKFYAALKAAGVIDAEDRLTGWADAEGRLIAARERNRERMKRRRGGANNPPRASPVTVERAEHDKRLTNEQPPHDHSTTTAQTANVQRTRDAPEQISMVASNDEAAPSAYPARWQDCIPFKRFKDAYPGGGNWQARAYPAFVKIAPDEAMLDAMLADLAARKACEDWHAPQPDRWLTQWAAGRAVR